MSFKREWKESPVYQVEDETIAYVLEIPTSWGTAPLSSISCTLYEDPDGANDDVSTSCLTGSASASGQYVTTESVTSLTAGKKYRFEQKFTTSEGNIQAPFCYILAQR